MQGNPQIALTLLKTFVKRIYDQRRRYMILKLNDIQARIADVFLMLHESDIGVGDAEDRLEFRVSTDDIAHWAGLQPEQARQVVNQFVNQRRLELLPDRIVVVNIHDLERLVSAKRKELG